MGVEIPPTNLQPEHFVQMRTFANGLADKLRAPVASLNQIEISANTDRLLHWL